MRAHLDDLDAAAKARAPALRQRPLAVAPCDRASCSSSTPAYLASHTCREGCEGAGLEVVPSGAQQCSFQGSGKHDSGRQDHGTPHRQAVSSSGTLGACAGQSRQLIGYLHFR